MAADTERTFTARMKGVGAAELSLGGVDLLQAVKGVDIYLRAGQTPEVVIRPVLQEMFLDLEAGDGREPRYIVSPEVGVLLTGLGWKSPEDVTALQARISDLDHQRCNGNDRQVMLEQEMEHQKNQHQTAVDRIKALEEERGSLAASVEAGEDRLAQLQEDLSTAHGRIQDLELANTSLQAELEAVQATQDRLQHPYDTTGR